MLSARKHDTNISIMNMNYVRLYYIQISFPDLREKYMTADQNFLWELGHYFMTLSALTQDF